jgi:hypothetical protein
MRNKLNLQIGDRVMVAKELAVLAHPESKKSHRAIVVAFYPNFFNVVYAEGWQQSIMYQDINKITLLSRRKAG